MAFKTVNLDCSIAMTTHTKVILIFGYTTGLFTCMAVDTFLEAVFFASNPLDNRFVTVMVQ
ncbi:MAG: hypothetical protein A2580_15770 [Hydrogenophilales bacterium RIFOXYD1_FULL_62_11]|nr:MAG: hypothetical protein A2580_15770 [Hydrogenophilales bacterium RIFOXYD1_FULL_62_11]